MKQLNAKKDERGFALVLTLILMAAMTAIGLAALMTSTTDMMIARNDREVKEAFYIAETGLAEALARLDLPNDHARFIGEDSDEKKQRQEDMDAGETVDIDPFANDSFTSATLSLADLDGEYTVTVDYAFEGSDTWDNGDGTVGEIVMYCTDFGFSGNGVPTSCTWAAHPVVVIDSIGSADTVKDTRVRVNTRLYVATSSLNVVPPGDAILFTEQQIDIGTGKTVRGGVASALDNPADRFPGDPCGGICTDFSGLQAVTDWDNGDMDEYLGMSIADLAAHADIVKSQSGSNEVPYSATGWGELCSPDTNVVNEDWHICNNDAKLIYIDNDGAGIAKLAANSTGRGILIVTGDLATMGDFMWEGMIYVLGDWDIRGSMTLVGTAMVQGTASEGVDVGGNMEIFGSIQTAVSVADEIGLPKQLRWSRLNL